MVERATGAAQLAPNPPTTEKPFRPPKSDRPKRTFYIDRSFSPPESHRRGRGFTEPEHFDGATPALEPDTDPTRG